MHTEGGFLQPFIANGYQNYKCTRCNQVLRYPTRKRTIIQTKVNRRTGQTLTFRLEAVTKRYDQM